MSFQSQQNGFANSSEQSRSQQELFSQESAHRGRIAHGTVQQPCSEDFLAVLCVEYCKAQSHELISTLRKMEDGDHQERLEFLIYEIERLLRYPQLFPSEPTRVRFLAFLASDSRFQLCEAITSLLMQNEIHTMQETWRKTVSRKDYLDGTRGWENFLLSDAPGLPFTSTRTNPGSVVQILPPVAARIVGDYEKEEKEIVRFVQQNNPPLGRPAQMTAMIDFDNPTEDSERVPDSDVPQLVQQATFRPNPYGKPRLPPLDLLTPATECLEDYSSFIDRLETNPPHPNAPQFVLSSSHILPALSIRTWNLPARARDLRYLR